MWGVVGPGQSPMVSSMAWHDPRGESEVAAPCVLHFYGGGLRLSTWCVCLCASLHPFYVSLRVPGTSGKRDGPACSLFPLVVDVVTVGWKGGP